MTGAGGQLGRDITARLNSLGFEALGADKKELDVTDGGCVKRYAAAFAPHAIIHCAAYTAVDQAEEERELCRLVNTEGTKNAAAAAEMLSAKFMYFSTDYVFDGSGERPFRIDDRKAPRNWYGQTKAESEDGLARLERLFLVRISWVFGGKGNNFVRTMLRLAETRDEIGVVDDQIGSPTYTRDLAELACRMIQTERYGIYHATNEGFCSWAELAEFIFACANKNVKVRRLTTEEYPTRAVRPKNSRLDKSSLDAGGFARLPHWKDAVRRYVEMLRREGPIGT